MAVLLIRPPFFTPSSPPLGICTLESFLTESGHAVRCLDLCQVHRLWQAHHEYFQVLREDRSTAAGYGEQWPVLLAHLLALVNGAQEDDCAEMLRTILPLHLLTYREGLDRSLSIIAATYLAQLREELERIDLDHFDVIGTSTYTTSLASALYILRWAKEKNPAIKTVMGGGIFADDLALGSDNLRVLLDSYPFIDHVVLGEGEILMKRLLEGDLSQRLLSIQEIGNETLAPERIPLPDFSDLDMGRYLQLIIEGARSCPFSCRFCSETIQWGAYRKKPTALLVDQMQHLSKTYNNHSFFMGDSLMNPYLKEMAGEMERRGWRAQLDGYLRAEERVAQPDRIEAARRAGLFRVRLGIESGSQEVLDLMNKRTTVQTSAEVLQRLAEAGIRTTTYWVVGYPGESEKQHQETLSFLLENHRFIYELEAHSFWYFPYGQVASRTFEAVPLYPEEVNRLLVLRRFTVGGSTPTQAERMERWRETTALAGSLGLPNIYSGPDLFDAEQRWLKMYPAAEDVYGFGV